MLGRVLRAHRKAPQPRTFPALTAANLPPARGRLEIVRDARGIPHVYAEDMTHAEAAQVMGVAENTVSWHLHAARKRLKAVLVSRD